MLGGFDIESEKLDKGGDFDNGSPPSRLFGLPLSDAALLTQLLIFCLRRREVLMSYFIARFEEVSPRWKSHLLIFQIILTSSPHKRTLLGHELHIWSTFTSVITSCINL